MIKIKNFLPVIVFSLLLVIFQAHFCLAQDSISSSNERGVAPVQQISSSNNAGSVSSETEAASKESTADKITPLPEEAQIEESNNSEKLKDETEKDTTPGSAVMSMDGGETSELVAGGLYIRPESVTVSQAGSATLSYPIEVPPGRGGLAPQIALNYSSSSHNGWVGVGWELSLGSIERSTKFGKPDYDNDDTFTLHMSGVSEELVKEGDEYRLKDEGAFLRLKKVNDIWEVTAKNGTKYYFGEDNTSRLTNGGSGIFRWCLNRIVDQNGNTITYTYYKDTTNNQIYPSQIDYDVDNHIKFVPARSLTPSITCITTMPGCMTRS